MKKQLFNQTGRLSRFILRRDRVRLPVWILSIALVTFLTASSFSGLYQSDEERQAIAETMMNPAMTAMVGPGYGIDDYHEGAMMAHQMLLFTAIAVAIMSILLVTRHTRTDEEEGRIELVRSLPAGRLSNLTSVMLVLFGANVVLALVTGLGLWAMGIGSIDLTGSLMYGISLGAVGLFFAAVTALFAQLSENGRGTVGLSFAFLGVAYLVRAIGDVSSEALAMISPLGWILRTEVYVNNVWWPVVLTFAAAVVVTAVALYLNTRRDLGAGYLPSRAGKKHASTFLLSPFGLAFRLQRTALISWAVGMFVLGATYGSVLGDLESFFESNEMMREMLAPDSDVSMTEQYLTLLMAVISMICTIPPVMMMLKLKGEEKKHRVDHLLSRVVSRGRMMGSYYVLAAVAGVVMPFLALVGLCSTAAGVMDEPIAFSVLFEALSVYVPAIFVVIGLAALFAGALPKWSGLVWMYLGYSFFVVYLGAMLQLPEWLGQLSPFGHVPEVPVEELNVATLAVLSGVAVVLVAGGFLGYRKRDIA
ncbi:ABC transporter permease [Alteribacter keqinensis]|uniref:ABC transporter permease n=1 Tax=Alteribacter keqinensis TaxID=2483800 RepID=A0A3M7TZZ1_9BACI|nr:ABC transporter permease [Alteribacter keqinensis]RNA70005.1 ABC transporter permease [Alteribacter keqinensis]